MPSNHPSNKPSVDRATFRRLLDRWNTHQDLRRSGACVSDLARSRAALDQIRAEIRTIA